ncbi:MAG TPA: hypothetical protein VK195_07435, partial [Burkholderiaceae bacterium]|nr:hypothetical protein [Burkholderiaceae bacterium]
MRMPAAFMLGWLLGLAVLHQLAQLPPAPWPGLMLAGAALLGPVLLLRRLPQWGRGLLLPVLGLAAGLGSGCLLAGQRLQARLGPA